MHKRFQNTKWLIKGGKKFDKAVFYTEMSEQKYHNRNNKRKARRLSS